MIEVILVINSGSSSIKFSIYKKNKILVMVYKGIITINVDQNFSSFKVFDQKLVEIINQNIYSISYDYLLPNLINWIYTFLTDYTLVGIGHRIVHGGKQFVSPVIITQDIINQLNQLIPLAPLHQWHNLEAVKMVAARYSDLTQVACFDNAFHHTQHDLARLFAIPRRLVNEGIVRYGFHGISYEYIASVINDFLGEVGNERVIVAHLGNGASMCAMYQHKSVATSMGFSTLDGLMMGTRCGSIDPGVILYLMQEKQYSLEQVSHLLYYESGVLGVSGISNDMQEVCASNNQDAIEAINLFCYKAAMEIGALSIALNGLDALVFTAGIGENSSRIRQGICAYLDWFGVSLDQEKNIANSHIISSTASKILVGVIPTNEEIIIATHTWKLIPSLVE